MASPAYAAMVAFGLVMGYYWDTGVRHFRFAREQIRRAATVYSRDRLSDERRRLASMQDAIPKGARVLALLKKPFLLDFERNTIHVFDLPGMTTPSPGIPLDKGADAVAGYLLSHGIRYVAFAHGDNAGYDGIKRSADRYGGSRWLKQLLPRAMACMDVLQQLASSRRRIYEDGGLLVMDLQCRSHPAVSHPPRPPKTPTK